MDVSDQCKRSKVATSSPMKNNLVEREENKDEEQEGGWSQLPAVLIWMIMDLLHIDSLRLAFVCKHWESMSLSYPLPAGSSGQRQCVPWMMHQRQNHIPCWDFVNLQTKERFTLEAPDHDRVVILFSRGGWLLYQQLDTLDHIVLYNIHTNAKIIMPEFEVPRTFSITIGIIGSFSTLDDDDDSPPYCVVLAPICTLVDKFLMANVNDKKWKVIDYLSYLHDQQRFLDLPHNLVIHGQKIYILFGKGGLMGFGMANLSWKKLDRDASEYHSPNGNIRCWFMESEGELVKILQHKDSNKFDLFKLNNSETDWEKLIQNDQDNRSWFLNKLNNGFYVKESGGGKKIYQLTRNYSNNNYKDVEPPDIHIHDLVSGTTQEYKPDQDGIWVDLGLINKMPPSCVSVGVVDWLV